VGRLVNESILSGAGSIANVAAAGSVEALTTAVPIAASDAAALLALLHGTITTALVADASYDIEVIDGSRYAYAGDAAIAACDDNG
jgi:hypothetical protein